MIELSAAGRAGTPDEVGAVGALLMGPDGAFITGSDFLMDGGVTAAYWYGTTMKENMRSLPLELFLTSYSRSRYRSSRNICSLTYHGAVRPRHW